MPGGLAGPSSARAQAEQQAQAERQGRKPEPKEKAAARTLVVRAGSGARATQLSSLLDTLVRSLNARLGADAVRTIRVLTPGRSVERLHRSS
ncbi:DciA family protein [Streptomyces sp. NPDC021093]|uniref:DciA family protein n=1 Tax=Streptomyces sp. NPDC021093 TaxID=3365112 RepID=UPI0037BCBB47